MSIPTLVASIHEVLGNLLSALNQLEHLLHGEVADLLLNLFPQRLQLLLVFIERHLEVQIGYHYFDLVLDFHPLLPLEVLDDPGVDAVPLIVQELVLERLAAIGVFCAASKRTQAESLDPLAVFCLAL